MTVWYAGRTNFLYMFIAFLYMFRATMCPSSGENTVPMRHMAFVTLYRWLSGMQGGIPLCIPDSHLYRVTNTRCRIDTVFSPNGGHIVARNIQRKAVNIVRKFVHQVGSNYKRHIQYLTVYEYTLNHSQKESVFNNCRHYLLRDALS